MKSSPACLNDDLAGLFCYLRFPVGHHKRLRHPNFIERTFGETRQLQELRRQLLHPTATSETVTPAA